MPHARPYWASYANALLIVRVRVLGLQDTGRGDVNPNYAAQQSADLTPRLTGFGHDTPLLHAKMTLTERYATRGEETGYETRPATGYLLKTQQLKRNAYDGPLSPNPARVSRVRSRSS